MIKSRAPFVKLCTSSNPPIQRLSSLVSHTLSSAAPAIKPLPLSAPVKLPSHSCPQQLPRATHSSAPFFAGHNRWTKIHRKKAIADQEKSVVITKFGKQIRSAIAISGGSDPDTNFKLANLIVRAKAAGMSKTQIETIMKADSKKVSLEHIVYEARAQAGYLVVMDIMTPNKNKCRADLRIILTKNRGSMGEPGSSLFNFIHKGIVRVPCQELLSSNTDADELGIEVGAEEVIMDDSSSVSNQDNEEEFNDEKCYQFICEPRDLSAVANAIKEQSFTVASASLDYTPKTLVKLGQKEYGAAEKLVGLLEAHDDVIEVYDNFVLDE